MQILWQVSRATNANRHNEWYVFNTVADLVAFLN